METPRHNKNEPVIENKNIMKYPSRTLDPPITLVDRALEIQQAESRIESHVNGKLDLIVKQIRNLQKEAAEIIKKAEKDVELHKVKCNFEKKPGIIIHLYVKNSGEKYFSRLSPEEWGTTPHQFLGSFQINSDLSFDEVI